MEVGRKEYILSQLFWVTPSFAILWNFKYCNQQFSCWDRDDEAEHLFGASLATKIAQTRPSILCVTHQMSRKKRDYSVDWTVPYLMMNYKWYLMVLGQYITIVGMLECPRTCSKDVLRTSFRDVLRVIVTKWLQACYTVKTVGHLFTVHKYI